MSREIIRIFNNEARLYQYKGVEGARLFPSVTTVLQAVSSKPHLFKWEKRLERERLRQDILALNQLPTSEMLKSDKHVTDVKQYFTNFGLKAHGMIEQMIKTGNDDISAPDPSLETLRSAFLSWKRGAQARGLRFETAELSLISEKYGYAGTIDAVARLSTGDSEKLIIIDWKTSSVFGNDHAIQLAAYAKLYEETYNRKVDRALIVRFDRDSPKVESKRVLDLERCFNYFLHYLKLYELTSDPELALLA